MAIEDALIKQSGQSMMAAKARALMGREKNKGCLGDLSPSPVALEPPFRDFAGRTQDAHLDGYAFFEPSPKQEDIVRLKIWVSPDGNLDWTRSELFLKQLSNVSHRVGFEVVGNEDQIAFTILCHRDDLPIVKSAFLGEFERCTLSDSDSTTFDDFSPEVWKDIVFNDYFPDPPYSHRLTGPSELHVSPYESLVTAMADIPKPAVGFYQTLFQPVSPDHDWHQNVQILLDLEYTAKLMSGLYPSQQYAQQSPSGDLRQMSSEVTAKAHNDKPFFATAIRVGLLGGREVGGDILRSLSPFVCLFQHGGRPLSHIHEKEYALHIDAEATRNMFLHGLTYRPGFLLNSLELSGLVHVPPASIFKFRQIPVDTLESLPPRSPTLSEGIVIGTCNYADTIRPVCISPRLQSRHSHIIGKSDMGKSSLLENMILQDIRNGTGVAILDPHGDLVNNLTRLIPEDCVDRTIHFNLGDQDWVPLWNPMLRIPGQDVGRAADDLVGSIKTLVTGWGDRLEHILRQAFLALLMIPNSTLLDVYNLLRHKSRETEILQRQILEHVDNEVTRQFWQHDFHEYRKDDLKPPQHKLGKLVNTGTVSLMLSQPESRFDFRKIMDDGQILLVDLSSVGSEVREILGCLFLAMLHLAAMSRADTAKDDRKPFRIYCDEAHRFVTDTVEDLISETRKFGVSLTLAHQYMSQFGTGKSDAISSVGSTIIFNVDMKDARYLTKDLRDMVEIRDLTTMDVGEAIARIGKEVVRIKTPMPPEIPDTHFREKIISLSRERYCMHKNEVRETIKKRHERWQTPFIGHASYSQDEEGHPITEEFEYDEW